MPPEAAARKRKRDRNADVKNDQIVETNSQAQDQPRKKRGRQSKNADVENNQRIESNSETQEQLRKKRGRPSNGENSRGRGASKSNRESGAAASRRRSSNAQAQNRNDGPSQASHQVGRTEQLYDGNAPYRHFTAVNKQIPRHVIDTTWDPLPAPAVDRISQIMNNVERSVVMRLQDERKRLQASTALQMVIRKLHRKIERGLPFPPSTRAQREEDFDFEKILDSSRQLEAQLTPALHSIELLKAEIRKEEALLQQENEILDKLERNAKAEKSRRKVEAKKFHPSLQVKDSFVKDEDFGDSLKLADQKISVPLLDNANTDEELQPIVEELQSHLESMESNFKQVEGIVPAMENTQALMRDILFKHVDVQRYEQIIMG